MAGSVIAVAKDGKHRFSKIEAPEIRILTGLGVEGDAHQGVTVKHRSRVRADPTQPNLRQVHLIHAELFSELKAQGFDIRPADLGENITTKGVDLLALPRGAILKLGDQVELEVTGLRNPCAQIENFRKGLLGAVLVKAANGTLIRKSGIMAVVRSGGTVKPGDAIAVINPPLPHLPLERV
ncbi:MOSC domain-containing protein [Paracoccus litorisediminis]|uniref:MOSC domain-containing protein n=1 Tax=Paracoccus litorisediminis TaxID=2006130 RepID=A0A844HNG4_9RHOB|nr:MOSC domain-containing protein [Paracoccus litorisediminis]MTH59202.1 MOSC domain-containing protein [Paracoccus litorisediminis]